MTKEEKANAIDSIKTGTEQLIALVPPGHMREANAAWDLIETGVSALRDKA